MVRLERFTLDVLRELVRPAVTLFLVGAQGFLAIAWGLGAGHSDSVEKAFAALAPFTMYAVTYYFKEREAERRIAQAVSDATP